MIYIDQPRALQAVRYRYLLTHHGHHGQETDFFSSKAYTQYCLIRAVQVLYESQRKRPRYV
jgi:hypothetical protein